MPTAGDALAKNRPTPAWIDRWRTLAGVVILLGLGLLLLAWLAYALFDSGFHEQTSDAVWRAGDSLYQTLMKEFFLTPWFYLLVVGILVLERFIPAAPRPQMLTKGLRQDLLWVVLHVFVLAWLLPTYIIFLRFLFDRHLAFLKIDAVQAWPWAARLLLALLFGDFMFWLIHLIRHHVPALWHFHAVHHSQKDLNFFTEYRVHPVDDLIAVTLGFIPILMVEHSYVTLVAIIWIRHWHTRICHSNLRSNFGLLRYVLVTPQSHRVHHSIEPRHIDKNFGLTFSIWDHLFGTQYRKYDEYPETGIEDMRFPSEQQRRGGLSVLWGQLAYPFRAQRRGQ